MNTQSGLPIKPPCPVLAVSGTSIFESCVFSTMTSIRDYLNHLMIVIMDTVNLLAFQFAIRRVTLWAAVTGNTSPIRTKLQIELEPITTCM